MVYFIKQSNTSYHKFTLIIHRREFEYQYWGENVVEYVSNTSSTLYNFYEPLVVFLIWPKNQRVE